jgi:hypothetical protein
MPTMHACCPQEHVGCTLEPPEKADNVLTCCTVQPASTTLASTDTDTLRLDGGLGTGTTAPLKLDALLEPDHQALRSQVYLADQSNRYLALRVLLN